MKGYIASMKGRPMLVDQRGHVYQRIRSSEATGRAFWRCREFKHKDWHCKANVVSLHNKITRITGSHEHPPLEKETPSQSRSRQSSK